MENELNSNLKMKLGTADESTVDLGNPIDKPVDSSFPEGAYVPPVGAPPVAEPEPLQPAAKPAGPAGGDPATEPNTAFADLEMDLGSLAPEPDPEPEPEPELDAVEQSITNESQRTAFIKLRQQLRDARNVPTPPPAVDPEMEEKMTSLQGELDQATDTIGKLSLADSPAFQRKYQLPFQMKMEQAMKYAEAAGVDKSAVETAARMGLAERNNFVQENFGNMGSTVMTILSEVDGLNNERRAELADWRSSKEALDASASQQNSTIRTEMVKDSFKSAISSLQGDNFLPFAYIDGNDAWNKTVDIFQAEAWDLFQRDDLPQQAKAMAAGIAAPHLLRSFLKERETVNELRAQLSALSGASPTPSARSGNSPAHTAQKEMSSAADAAKQASQRFAQRSVS